MPPDACSSTTNYFMIVPENTKVRRIRPSSPSPLGTPDQTLIWVELE